MSNQAIKNGLKVKKIKLPHMNSFLEKQNFHVLITPFHSARILKELDLIQTYQDVSFSGPKWPICAEHSFFGTNHYYFHLPVALFTGQKNVGPKMAHLPKRDFFFQKTC